jgi:hypothetical protein
MLAWAGYGHLGPHDDFLRHRALVFRMGSTRFKHALEVIDVNVRPDRPLRKDPCRRQHDAVPALARIAAHLAKLECRGGNERDERIGPEDVRVDSECCEIVRFPPIFGFDGERACSALEVGATEGRREIPWQARAGTVKRPEPRISVPPLDPIWYGHRVVATESNSFDGLRNRPPFGPLTRPCAPALRPADLGICRVA